MLERIIGRYLKDKYFPTQHQLMVRKWHADGGDQKLRFNYHLDKNSVVIDLGGYEGQWASDLFGRYQCPILVFEPVQSFANRMEKRFTGNDNITIYSYGLGASSRYEQIHVAGDSSSIYRNKGIKEKIKIIDIKDWMSEHLEADQDIDLMKINIEGGEYELLERLVETNLISRINNIQVQFHEIANDSYDRMKQIQKNLINTHEPTYQYKFVWENWMRKMPADT